MKKILALLLLITFPSGLSAQTGTKGVNIGATTGGTIGTSDFSFNTTIAQAGSNVQYHFAVNPVEVTGTVTVSNNYADPTGSAGDFFLLGSPCNPCSGGGTSTFTNNINLLNGAIFTPPTVVTPPLLSNNTPQSGNTINTTNGTWNNAPTAFAYQWRSAATCTGSSPSATGAGATTASYIVAQADVGNTLCVSVTASNPSGSSTASTSVATSAVTNSSTGFTISGGQIFNPAGQRWVGRGIKIASNEINAAGTGFAAVNQPATTPLTSTFPGINIVFIYLTSVDKQFSAGFATMQPYINALTAAGIVVVLQQDVEGEFGLSQPIAPLTDGQLTTSTGFVSQWATTYKSNPYVWFASMNEPCAFNNCTGALNPTPVLAMQQAYYNAVRSVGNNSLFIVDATGNDFDEVITPAYTSTFGAMKGVMWDTHYYNTNDGPDNGSTTVAGNLAAIAVLTNKFGGVNSLDGPMPVTIMEAGTSCCNVVFDPGWPQGIQAVETAPNVQATGAYTWWNGNQFNSLLLGANAAGGLSPFGTEVQPYIASGHLP